MEPTLGRKLLFTTLRLVNHGTHGSSVGTGFIFDGARSDGRSALVVVTNKHVLEHADVLEVSFIAKHATDDVPLLGQLVTVRIGDIGAAWTGHPDPDVDVAAFPFGPLLPQLSSPVFFRSLSSEIMPPLAGDSGLDAIEEVTFVGYPNGHFDTAHGTPLVRRGITATPLDLPFGGKPVFLVNGSVFGGSSGSPISLFESGSFAGGMIRTEGRVVLLGIIAATVQRETLHPLVASRPPHVRIAQELNLGIAYNWRAIEETLEALFARHGETR
jgi:hypothetical protein